MSYIARQCDTLWDMKIQRSIRLGEEVDAALQYHAERMERSVSQLVEMACREKYMIPAGSLSHDGRESEGTKAARERGTLPRGVVRASSLAKDPAALERQRRLNEGKGS